MITYLRCKSRGAGKTAGYGKAGGLNGKEVKNTAETITGYTECIIQSVYEMTVSYISINNYSINCGVIEYVL